jgi:hypothetical protein
VRVEDGPRWGRDDVVRSVRLVPDVGAPLLFLTHDDGRVEVGRGAWDERSFSATCPRRSDGRRTSSWGTFTSYRRRAWDGRSASDGTIRPVDFIRYEAMAPPGRYDWPPWPRHTSLP